GSDGRVARLAHQPVVSPQAATISGEVGVSADGTLWVRAVAEGLPNWDYLSRDNGRTWFEVRGPAGTGIVYRTSGPYLLAVDAQKHTLWSSKNGDHWDPVSLPFSTAGVTSALLFEQQSDGSLLVGDSIHRRAYLLAEGTFHGAEVTLDEH